MSEDVFHLGVKAIIRNASGELLLLKVNLAKLKGYIGDPYWDTPGGRVKKGDSVEQTLVREVAEETGITSLTSYRPFSMVLSPIRIPTGADTVGLILSAYVCDVGDVETIRLSDEHRNLVGLAHQKLLSF